MSKPRFSKLQKLIIIIDYLARPSGHVLLQRDIRKVIGRHENYSNENTLNASLSRSLTNLESYGLVDRAWVSRATYKKWRHAYPVSYTDPEPTPYKTWDFRTLAIQVSEPLKERFTDKLVNNDLLGFVCEIFDPYKKEIYEPADWVKAAIPDRELRRSGVGAFSPGRERVRKMLKKYEYESSGPDWGNS